MAANLINGDDLTVAVKVVKEWVDSRFGNMSTELSQNTEETANVTSEINSILTD